MENFRNFDGIVYREMNMTIPFHRKFIIERMLKSKQKIALIDGVTGDQLTFNDMVQLIVNVADSLSRLGVKSGDVVGICSENRFEFLITTIAVWCTNAVATFFNAGYSQNEMVHSMNISKPKYLFLSPDTYNKYYKTMVGTKLVDSFFVFGSTANDSNVRNFEEVSKRRVDVDLFRTKPDTEFQDTIGEGNMKNISKCLSVAPWSNTAGIMLTLENLLSNKTIIYLARFKEEKYLSCIEKYQPGLLLVVPPLVVMLTKSMNVNKYDVSSVEIIYSGGATLDLAVINEVKEKFPNLALVLQGYGMTEATGAITEETLTQNRQGSIGKVAIGSFIKIVDETGKTLGPHKAGELCIRGPALFDGYIGKNIIDDLDEEGFFKTGDICYYDEDGYFFFVERLKELIKYKAGQVSPSELEGLLLQHPAVKDAGVVGKPDPLVGELPTAFVVKKPGMEVSSEELMDFVASKISSWKQLRGGVHFIDEIPKIASGKILRRELRNLLSKFKSKI